MVKFCQWERGTSKNCNARQFDKYTTLLQKRVFEQMSALGEDQSKRENSDEKKRKRETLSSASSILDTSATSASSPCDTNLQKKKKKKKKQEKAEKESIENMASDKGKQSELSKISKQMSELNSKMSTMISKEDGSLRSIIKEIFNEMKEEFLKSVSHRIDMLEGKLFEKETQNEDLKKEVNMLEKKIAAQKLENENLRDEITKRENKTNEKINHLEQYSRINNIRISGLEEEESENRTKTEDKVVSFLNSNISNLNLQKKDIEIAHRLGQKKEGKVRQIIVKLYSRNTKSTLLSKRKQLKGCGVYINEDLTQMNQHVFSCVRRKQPDEIDSVWTVNGTIFYKNKTGNIHRVNFSDFEHWIDLPWPDTKTKVINTNVAPSDEVII